MMRFETYEHDAAILQARDLTCRRGGRLLFRGLAFDFTGGQLVALRGGNGSGKTSLLRILSGLLAPFSGQLQKPGVDQMHYIAHQNGLKSRMTVHENLSFWKNWLAADISYDASRASYDASRAMSCQQALAYAGLEDRMDLAAGDLSAGQKRRLSLARLLVAPRPIWLLDEPDTALDENGKAWLARLMEAHKEAGGLAVVATHAPLPTANMQLQLSDTSGQQKPVRAHEVTE